MSMSILNNYSVVKGCVDYWGDSYDQIKLYKDILEDIFSKNDGTPLETPVFENKEVLMNKYGDEAETKLVYNINEEGGHPLTLRYDLTVPFIRFITENGIKKMRRYSIGKVYRRDQPQLSKGRLREFYQADFDILGESNTSMIPETVIFLMIKDFMDRINKSSNYKIYINHTANLNYILCKELELDPVNFKKVCGLIDKIEFTSPKIFEESFKVLEPEFSKYFSPDFILKLKMLIQNPTPLDPTVKEQWDKILAYCQIFNMSDKFEFSSCLARGLDYYNGFIFEVKMIDSACSNTIIAGGRYDNIINTNTLIGVSFGISRIQQLINEQNKNKNQIQLDIKWKQSMYVTRLGKIDVETKLQVIKILKEKYPNNQIVFDTNESDRKLTPVLNNCVKNKYKYIVIIGENELAQGQIIIKDLEMETSQLVNIN